MKCLYHPTVLRTPLPASDKRRCDSAIRQFQDNPLHPGLNYERLGKNWKQNHCSIRASRELRLILAVEPDFQAPEVVVFVNMGHHDQMYQWAERQGFFTDPGEGLDMGGRALAQGSDEEHPAVLESFEDWQVFLHPDQEPLVKRQYADAARIRGAAGTGKTIVALHRAKELGHRFSGEKVLFTTFSRSLTEHLKRLYGRIPDAAVNVEFINIDRVAFSLVKPTIDRRKATEAFEQAYRAVIHGSRLEKCSADYLKDEIDKVIKGRAATREEYLDTDRFERLGRRRKFNRSDRELCWRLREAWDESMRAAAITDFTDAMIVARDLARQQTAPEYRAVIVDEAQDMTLVGMQLVRALVAGHPRNPVPPDGLLMLDDAAQRIYSGGFRLAWAGIQVSGRAEILQTNYRNTRQIVEAAKTVRGDVLPVREDNDDGAALHVQFEHEDGIRPQFIQVAKQGEISAIAEKVRELVNDCDYRPETIGVLTRSNDDCKQIRKFLERQLGIPCVLLKDMRGNDPLGKGVRVGTFDRSKGLEFRAVLIPRLGASVFPKAEDEQHHQLAFSGVADAPRELTEEEREARQLDLDRLYVGMTRAKERLYLIADESTCPEIDRARKLMD
ncbi:MAG: UvrD-helicase domain-containing protein [Gammaproteobacteria bacterium]|nr:UvrD-helicase domain-containing protein [Gammaproteobacteria bacterium]MDE0366623.1 UvrD-helicase domain-containing protein [Gammaproteobacteria bacterium]